MFDSFSPIERLEKPGKIEYGQSNLSEIVKDIFYSQGIDQLYKHQADAINLIREGKNVIISSPTASGKTEIYLSEVADATLQGKNSLILYPTKALSRDQLKKFQSFSLYGVIPKIYDGDTPDTQRKKIRMDNPKILISNVDMLHHILMNNRSFKNFFKNLKFVVMDEAHAYSGILGCHVSQVFWRLKRICPNPLQFILTSATIRNAKSFAKELIGEEIEEVKGTSGKRSKIRHFMISPEDRSYISTTLELLDKIGKKTLIFGNSHSVVERLSLFGKNQDLSIGVYRGGLRYDKRKEIESQFKKGHIKYLATTSALELGIDIGSVDAVILAGFPGTITRVQQRIGRAGRKGQEALAFFIARQSPLDQYYIDNPEEYFNGLPETCFVNPNNLEIKKLHLIAAARDKLLKKEELEEFQDLVEIMEKEELLKNWTNFYSPTKEGLELIRTLNLRGVGNRIKIYNSETEKLMGEREVSIGLGELFEGAIYLHSGRPYVSEQLDLIHKKAFITPLNRQVNEFTVPLKDKSISVIEELNSGEFKGHPISFGKIHITDSLQGYKVKDATTGRVLSENNFADPYVHDYDGNGFWIDLESLVFDVDDFPSGLHAFEHVAISMIPALTGSDGKEIGGLSYPSGLMYVYDSLPYGTGVTNVIFDNFETICDMTYNRLSNCKCSEGCPSCIFDSSCGNDNRYLNKQSAIDLLEKLFKQT